MSDQKETTPYFFRHCDKPTIDPVNGSAVKGELPAWLSGTLIRNGPGIQKIGNDTFEHMFDGMAVLHRFHIDNGKATYSSRPLESDTYHKNMAAERIVIGEFGTAGYGDPCDTLFNKFKSMFITKPKSSVEESTDNCCVNVGYYGDQLYAMTEINFVRRIDPENLKCVGEKTNLTKYVAINQASAHPHILPDGTALNLGINHKHATKGSCYCIISVPPAYNTDETAFKNSKIICEIPLRWRLYPSYYHSFGMTTDKLIFVEHPYCLRIPNWLLYKTFFRVSYRELLHWYPDQTTRIHVASMNNGEIHPVIYECKNLFTFHHCNAYEEDGYLIVDVAAYSSAEFVGRDINRDNFAKTSEVYKGAGAKRYILPLDISNAKPGENLVTLKSTTATAHLRNGTSNTIDLEPEVLDDQWFEFPKINYHYNGRKYRYLYGANSSTSEESRSAVPETNILVKLDLETKEKLKWYEDGVWASEPVFIQNSSIENPAEDDGVILANLLYKNDENKTTLLTLDAKNMQEISRVDFKTDGCVTTTFHGQWATAGDKVHLY